MSVFTKTLNHLQTLLEGESSTQKLQEAFEELHKANLTLETAHKSYTLLAEEEVFAAEGDYLTDHVNALAQMNLKVSTATEVAGRLDTGQRLLPEG